MAKALYTSPPPHTQSRKSAHFLKLLPIAALLAAPQAWAVDSGGTKPTSMPDWYIGCGTTLPCPGSHNKAVLVDSDYDHEFVAGGYSDKDDTSGEVDTSGQANDNELTIKSGGNVGTRAYGGYAIGTGTQADINRLTIEYGGYVRWEAYGGYSVDGSATENILTIQGKTDDDVWGGYAGNGSATLNEVHVDNGAAGYKVYGGEAFKGNATQNKVFIINGTVDDEVRGGFADEGNASKNTVTFDSGSVDDDIAGGRAHVGNATDNEVSINGGTAVKRVFGGYANGGSATGNTITLTGGTVKGMVTGGSAYDGSATGNTITLTGGTAERNVQGGDASEGDATGNTITLAGGAVKGAVLGGWCYHSSDPCDDTGNTLAVHAQGSTVGAHVDKFEKLEFKLPAGVAGNTMLKVGDYAAFPTLGAPSTTEVKIALADGAKLKEGESITLIETGTNGSGVLEIKLASTTVTTPDGYVFELTADPTKLVAKVVQEPQPPAPQPQPPTPVPYYYSGDNSSPTMGELGLLLSGLALAGAAAPALRRREKQGKKADTRQ